MNFRLMFPVRFKILSLETNSSRTSQNQTKSSPFFSTTTNSRTSRSRASKASARTTISALELPGPLEKSARMTMMTSSGMAVRSRPRSSPSSKTGTATTMVSIRPPVDAEEAALRVVREVVGEVNQVPRGATKGRLPCRKTERLYTHSLLCTAQEPCSIHIY